MSVFPIRLQAPLERGPCLIHLFISSNYHKGWLIVGTKILLDELMNECTIESPVME